MRSLTVQRYELDGSEKLSVQADFDESDTVTLTIAQYDKVLELEFGSAHLDAIAKLWERLMALRALECSARLSLQDEESLEDMMVRLS
jgi:hypothetical protein